MTSDQVYERLNEQRDRLERDLLAAVLGSPRQAIPELERCGLTPEMIEAEDLRLMLHICIRDWQLPRDNILRLIVEELRAEGYWDDTQLAGAESMLWSVAAFAAFTDRFSRWESPMCRSEAAIWANRLVKLSWAMSDAKEHFDRGYKLLEDAAA